MLRRAFFFFLFAMKMGDDFAEKNLQFHVPQITQSVNYM